MDFIVKLRKEENADVHEVTQLVTSLLGIIVFPWEPTALQHLESIRLSELEAKGWPQWYILLDEYDDNNKPTKTLYKLTEHLRNAIAHRRLKFSSDDREMRNVDIEFEDAIRVNKNTWRVNWRVKINAAELREFCDRFTKELENLVG